LTAKESGAGGSSRLGAVLHAQQLDRNSSDQWQGLIFLKTGKPQDA